MSWKRAMEQECFDRLLAFCIPNDEFTLSGSLFRPQVTPTRSERKWIWPLPTPNLWERPCSPSKHMMWWMQLPNHQQKEAEWWSNVRFRMKDSCGNQTTPLSSRASSNGMVSICSCSCSKKRCEKSTKTPGISLARFWKMQGKRWSRGFCLMCVNNSLLASPFRGSGSNHKTSNQQGVNANKPLLCNETFLPLWKAVTKTFFETYFGITKWSGSTSWKEKKNRPPGQLKGAVRDSFIMISNEVCEMLCPGVLQELTKACTQRNVVSPPAHITQLFKCNSCFLPRS